MKILKLLLPTLLIIGIAFSNAAYAQTEKASARAVAENQQRIVQTYQRAQNENGADPGAAEADAADDY